MKPAYSLLAACALAACTLALAQSGPAIDVSKVTHGIEQHYNSIKSLKADFTETRVDRAGRHRPMAGVVYLEKPRKMKWEYSAPAGQFLVSDGAYDYDFDPATKVVEQTKVKEADDMRGPLALLLGKIDFDRDFGSYSTSATDASITAIPKSDKLLFSSITFVAGPGGKVKSLSIKGQDGSVTSFTFENEIDNPPLPAGLFKFVLPPGAVLDAAKP